MAADNAAPIASLEGTMVVFIYIHALNVYVSRQTSIVGIYGKREYDVI